jgi:hypothetical protein
MVKIIDRVKSSATQSTLPACESCGGSCRRFHAMLGANLNRERVPPKTAQYGSFSE